MVGRRDSSSYLFRKVLGGLMEDAVYYWELIHFFLFLLVKQIESRGASEQ